MCENFSSSPISLGKGVFHIQNVLGLGADPRGQGCANPRKFANICEFIDEICEFDLGEVIH